MLKILGAMALLAVSAPAQAEMWCLSDFGNPQRTCVFSSLGDCVRAAKVGGGRCERQFTATRRPVSESEPILPRAPRVLVR